MTFRQFYDDHVAFVWRTLRLLGVHESYIHDSMQDVLVVVFRRLPHFHPTGEIKSWIFRICARTAKDYRRRAHIRHEVFDELPIGLACDAGLDAADELQKREDAAMLQQALAKLDIDQRAVFVLFELENMTGEEIASALDLPLGTVYSRLRLARQAFRRAAQVFVARQRFPRTA
jgi:RNA polymerase sigma-70 factor (ECF subfamily)